MIEGMFRTMFAIAALLTAGLLTTGCGVASPDSKYQDTHGISPKNDYPAGSPIDPGSPALSSSTESKYSRDQEASDELNTPKAERTNEQPPATNK